MSARLERLADLLADRARERGMTAGAVVEREASLLSPRERAELVDMVGARVQPLHMAGDAARERVLAAARGWAACAYVQGYMGLDDAEVMRMLADDLEAVQNGKSTARLEQA